MTFNADTIQSKDYIFGDAKIGPRDPASGISTITATDSSFPGTLITKNDLISFSGPVVDSTLGAGATVTNVLYVTGDGDDNNTGKKLGDAKASIKGAVAISTTGDVIRVAAGTYTESNPIAIPKQVSIIGDSLREVTVVPSNAGSDLFHVAPGNYLSEMSFTGTMTAGSAICAFNPNKIYYNTDY